ncbi:hypothetical protein LSUE1_G009829 [Lachnellula suecica]|uniref:Yeast cell wall synthesis Kre9/Knh1-like N-terminal domain-containing protein n=1 Tax=Lachnellula suecica TaxID=602035 RepID=A0A8T9BXI9_9HELO|nr:hypothetical protein LSUE1_G009829 [Lachnellula suecica]
MQFSSFFLAAAAIAAANATVILTNTVYNDITAGVPYPIGFSNNTGPVTITLQNGGANNLQDVSTIASGISTSPYTWSVPSDLAADTYAIKISDGSTTNYGPQFQLLGATNSVTSVTASSTSTGSSSSASSSASTTVTSTTSTGTSTSLTSTGTSSSSASTATSASNSSSSSKASSSGSMTSSASASKTSSTTASTSSAAAVPTTNSASEFASPLALVFLTFAAILTLN